MSSYYSRSFQRGPLYFPDPDWKDKRKAAGKHDIVISRTKTKGVLIWAGETPDGLKKWFDRQLARQYRHATTRPVQVKGRWEIGLDSLAWLVLGVERATTFYYWSDGAQNYVNELGHETWLEQLAAARRDMAEPCRFCDEKSVGRHGLEGVPLCYNHAGDWLDGVENE